MIINWEGMYHNGCFYSAGLYANNGIVSYAAPAAAVVQIILTDEGLALKITDSFYILL
jgi:hypothetical protein